MSHTRTHMPYTALLFDVRNVVENHDHRHGPCDLVPLHDWAKLARDGQFLWRARRCIWDLRPGVMACGCPMCTQSAWRREERRRSRHQARQGRDLDGQ